MLTQNDEGQLMTEAREEHLMRRQIIDVAKRLVMADGPDNVLEFGLEILDKYGYREKYDTVTYLAIADEARHQSFRVIEFLGYEATSR
jgi:hypothetical protein